MKRMAKQRRSPRLPSYFKQVARIEDEHPIYLAVCRRKPQLAAQERRLTRLQRKVWSQLGSNTKAFKDMDDLRADISSEREEAYFDVGYEHGLTEGIARARRAALSKPGRQLARDLRERLAQAQLPRDEAVLVLMECLGAALIARDARPKSRRALRAGTPA